MGLSVSWLALWPRRTRSQRPRDRTAREAVTGLAVTRKDPMNVSNAALVFGIVFVLAGLSGFFAAPPPPDAPPLTVAQGHGLALGLFPVNTLHNVVHLLFGVLGIAALAAPWCRRAEYFRLVAVAYALLVVLGLIPATQTTFGLIPIWGNDVWLHALLAAGAAYFGFVGRPRPLERECNWSGGSGGSGGSGQVR